MNVNVQVLPRGPLADDEALLAANRTQIEAMAGLELDAIELGPCGKQQVVFAEYHGRIGAMQPMHFLAILYLRGDEQVVITATTIEKRWKGDEAMLRKLLLGVTITPP